MERYRPPPSFLLQSFPPIEITSETIGNVDVGYHYDLNQMNRICQCVFSVSHHPLDCVFSKDVLQLLGIPEHLLEKPKSFYLPSPVDLCVVHQDEEPFRVSVHNVSCDSVADGLKLWIFRPTPMKFLKRSQFCFAKNFKISKHGGFDPKYFHNFRRTIESIYNIRDNDSIRHLLELPHVSDWHYREILRKLTNTSSKSPSENILSYFTARMLCLPTVSVVITAEEYGWVMKYLKHAEILLSEDILNHDKFKTTLRHWTSLGRVYWNKRPADLVRFAEAFPGNIEVSVLFDTVLNCISANPPLFLKALFEPLGEELQRITGDELERIGDYMTSMLNKVKGLPFTEKPPNSIYWNSPFTFVFRLIVKHLYPHFKHERSLQLLKLKRVKTGPEWIMMLRKCHEAFSSPEHSPNIVQLIDGYCDDYPTEGLFAIEFYLMTSGFLKNLHLKRGLFFNSAKAITTITSRFVTSNTIRCLTILAELGLHRLFSVVVQTNLHEISTMDPVNMNLFLESVSKNSGAEYCLPVAMKYLSQVASPKRPLATPPGFQSHLSTEIWKLLTQSCLEHSGNHFHAVLKMPERFFNMIVPQKLEENPRSLNTWIEFKKALPLILLYGFGIDFDYGGFADDAPCGEDFGVADVEELISFLVQRYFITGEIECEIKVTIIHPSSHMGEPIINAV